MMRSQIAELLTVAATIDGRDFDETTVDVWHKLLADVPAEKAAKALEEHYSSSSRRIMPADIKRAAAPRPREQWLV